MNCIRHLDELYWTPGWIVLDTCIWHQSQQVNCPANDGCLISYGESSFNKIMFMACLQPTLKKIFKGCQDFCQKIEKYPQVMTNQRRQLMGTFLWGIARMHMKAARLLLFSWYISNNMVILWRSLWYISNNIWWQSDDTHEGGKVVASLGPPKDIDLNLT